MGKKKTISIKVLLSYAQYELPVKCATCEKRRMRHDDRRASKKRTSKSIEILLDINVHNDGEGISVRVGEDEHITASEAEGTEIEGSPVTKIEDAVIEESIIQNIGKNESYSVPCEDEREDLQMPRESDLRNLVEPWWKTGERKSSHSNEKLFDEVIVVED